MTIYLCQPINKEDLSWGAVDGYSMLALIMVRSSSWTVGNNDVNHTHPSFAITIYFSIDFSLTNIYYFF